MTLTRAEIQFVDAFEAGQVYVALSRLTSMHGLWIRGGGISTVKPKAHPTVLQYYHCVSATDPRALRGSLDRLFQHGSASLPRVDSEWVDAPLSWGDGVIQVD